jgi:hypothetical protein
LNASHLSPDEFAAAVLVCVGLCPTERSLTDWGAAHSAALASIKATHPIHHKAARDAYARRLAELRREAAT